MATRSSMPRALVGAALPLMLVGTYSASGAHAESASVAAAKPAYVLDVDSGRFAGQHTGAVRAQTGSAGVDGRQILHVPGQPAAVGSLAQAGAPVAERAAWASSTSFTDLSWASGKGDTWTVYKNDRVIGTTATGSFRDVHVTAGTDTAYRITGGNRKADKGSTWTLIASTPKSESPADLRLAAKAKKKYKTTLVWRSFIRQKWAYVPSGWKQKASGCKYAGGYKYGGDNRGFSSKRTGPSFRAGVTGVIYWNKSSYDLYPQTGTTHVYKVRTGKLVAKKKASTKNIDFRAKTRFNGKTRQVHAEIEASDPFCKRGGIGVFYDARLYSDGGIYVSGKYKNAPDHEMYAYIYSDSKHYKTLSIHRSRMQSLSCLFKNPLCEVKSIAY